MLVPTGTASLVLERFLDGTDISTLAQLIASFIFPKPTWVLAFSKRHTDETCLVDVQFLHTQQIPEPHARSSRESDHVYTGYTFMDEAAARGFLSVVQFLHSHSQIGCTEKAMAGASRNGHFQVVRYLHEVARAEVSRDAWRGAAENGHLHVLQYLHRLYLEPPVGMRTTSRDWGSYQLEGAVKRNDLEMVQWLYANRPERCQAWLFLEAIRMGCTEVVVFLYESGATMEFHVAIECAARAGQLKLIQYFHSHTSDGGDSARGFPTNTMDIAAKHGHLEVVQFLHTHRHEGCTIDAMNQAAKHGHLDVVQFLHHNRTGGCTSAAMNEAAKHGHLDVVQFLDTHRQEGCTTYAMNEAAANGHLDVIQYLHENRTEGHKSIALDNAACNGHLAVVQFLYTNRRNGWYKPGSVSRKTLQKIITNGHANVLQYLVDLTLVKLEPSDSKMMPRGHLN